MKYISLLSSVLLLSCLISFSQEVQFSPAVISSGGSSYTNGPVTLSRWRIGQVNVITLPSEESNQKPAAVVPDLLPDLTLPDWSIIIFPNPVQSKLSILFDMDVEGQFAFRIFDVTGRMMLDEKAGLIVPGQIFELDLSRLTPALYLLKIIPSGEKFHKQFRIIKK